MGTSPIASGALTGFALQKDITGTFATSAFVTGRVYAADFTQPTPTMLTGAVDDMMAAYDDAANRPDPDFINLSGGTLNGEILEPGLYRWVSAVTGTFNVATYSNMKVMGGAKADNIFWQIAGAVTLTTYSHFEGILLGATSGVFQTGSSINGCALLQTAVTLDTVAINCGVGMSDDSSEPSNEPSLLPSYKPSQLPSDKPTFLPSDDPSMFPSNEPS
eukprot:scaffold10666_cov328-Chaetoceros_neogracile.AAC.1